jgi:cytochrome c oxidase subunit II
MTRLCHWAGILAGLLLLEACSDVQSVLAPAGLHASQIASLAWLLFGFGTIVVTMVVTSAWLAIRGSPSARRILAQERVVVALGILFPAVTLTLLLAYGVWVTRSNLQTDKADTVRIEVTGEQWWWRIRYFTADGTVVASANEIRIPVALQVQFTLRAADVIHSFWIPSLGGKADMIPGRVTHLRLVAERAGTYRGQCAEYCGGAHALMAFPVLAMSASEYAGWLQRELGPAVAPATEAQRNGQSLFLSAGCGTCHSIRGTAALGTVGPDLTRLGSRRSVGIDTLPLTQFNVARFIVAGQHVKPANPMPEFDIFRPEERDALAAYLVSLK